MSRMPSLNARHRQPIAALLYTSAGAFLVAAAIFYVGFALATSRTLDGSVPPGLTAVLFAVIFLASIVTLAYPVLHYLLLSYEVGEHAITINSGILFRQHETINYNRIQVIDNERGPILMIFGLTRLEIWTASHAGHASSPAAVPEPDAHILLDKDTAENLMNYVLHRPTGGSL